MPARASGTGQLSLQSCLFSYTEFVSSISPPHDRDGGISSSWSLSCPSPNSDAHLHSHARSECHLNGPPPNAFALPISTCPPLAPSRLGAFFAFYLTFFTSQYSILSIYNYYYPISTSLFFLEFAYIISFRCSIFSFFFLYAILPLSLHLISSLLAKK